jgi:hypothetical protein
MGVRTLIIFNSCSLWIHAQSALERHGDRDESLESGVSINQWKSTQNDFLFEFVEQVTLCSLRKGVDRCQWGKSPFCLTNHDTLRHLTH